MPQYLPETCLTLVLPCLKMCFLIKVSSILFLFSDGLLNPLSNSQIFLREYTQLACSFLLIILSYGSYLLPGHLVLTSLPLFIHICNICRERYMPINSINVKLFFNFVQGIYLIHFVKDFWFSFFFSSFFSFTMSIWDDIAEKIE